MSLSSAIAAQHLLRAGRADPLANVKLVPKQLEFIQAAARTTETALRAANKFGKSTIAAMFTVACLQGRRTLAGVELPRLRSRPAPVAWALTRTYKQQVEGTQAAVSFALGDWPHQIAWENRAEGIWAAVWIRPENWPNADPQSWAKLVFNSQQSSRNDGNVGLGARLDLAWFDEPGFPTVVGELRKAGRPGLPFRMLHSFTPIFRDQWEGIRRDIESPGGGIMEVTASIYDAVRGRVPNGFLSEDEVAELAAKYSMQPELADARLYGYYCDVAGSSPWSPKALAMLNQWLNRSEPARELRAYELQGEKDSGEGRGLVTERVEVEMWWAPEKGGDYLIVADPAEGIDDGKHDPLALVVIETRRPRLVACYSGYCSPHGLGNLAGQLARHYNGALVDPETQGGWGGPFLTGLRSARYNRVGHDTQPSAPGQVRQVLGFKTTDQTRPLYFSALHQAMLEDSVYIPSRSVLSQILAVELDKHGRPAASFGGHDEYVICMGRALYRIANLRAYRPAPRPERHVHLIERIARRGRESKPVGGDNWLEG